jgi:methionine biosynthesis protein MetW
VEVEDDKVIASVANGVNVIQADLERGLWGFDDGSFDYVLLSLTLQAVRHTEAIVLEMLRVGREAIVTFPNFGHWQARWQVALGGRMPVSDTLPYQWYDTPNVHLCTIRDFERFCADHGVRILERLVLHGGRPVTWLPNLLGSLAVFRFERLAH